MYFIYKQQTFFWKKETLWQAWRSPASLLTHRVRGCHEIDHLKESPSIYMFKYSSPFQKGQDILRQCVKR